VIYGFIKLACVRYDLFDGGGEFENSPGLDGVADCCGFYEMWPCWNRSTHGPAAATRSN
jgi:hypothetical protein